MPDPGVSRKEMKAALHNLVHEAEAAAKVLDHHDSEADAQMLRDELRAARKALRKAEGLAFVPKRSVEGPLAWGFALLNRLVREEGQALTVSMTQNERIGIFERAADDEEATCIGEGDTFSEAVRDTVRRILIPSQRP
jgi:hypothetical protein